jgi:hypothetical protein
MTVETHAIVLGYRSAEEIASLIEASYGQTVSLSKQPSLGNQNPGHENVSIASFKQKNGTSVAMYILTNGHCAGDYAKTYKGEATFLSLSFHGDSVAIMRGVLEHTGGYLIASDYRDDAPEYVLPKASSLVMA